MNFDKHAYEREQNRRLQEVSARLREFVQFDGAGLGPVVEFLCPRGHSLKRYRADDQGEHVFLQALPGIAAAAGPVASNGSPWNSAKHVCEVPGCPALVDYEGTCADHGGRRSEAVHGTRTRFACNRCSWSDAFTTARLVQVYGLAIHLEVEQIPVTGAQPSARRGR